MIATKMSNHRGEGTRSFQDGVAMYRNSLRELQVDYIDYYLLHSVGASVEEFNQRYIDNGLLDFLVAEREAGRIRNLGWSFHGISEVFDHVLNYGIQWDFCQIQLNYQDWQHATGRNVNAEYLYGELVKKNIPAIIMEPLLGGRLSRVPAQALQLMKEMRPQDSAASWAFRYAGTPELVLTVLSGMVYMEHLQENIRTYSLSARTPSRGRIRPAGTGDGYPVERGFYSVYGMPVLHALSLRNRHSGRIRTL